MWISATRPRTLTASVAPVAMGTAIAQGAGLFHAGGALAALGGALGIQIACNFANDYFDARQGADSPARLGPRRAVAAGMIRPRAMLTATVLVILVLVVPAVVYLTQRGGWPFVALGATSVILAFAYTGSRWSIAYLGLGDLFALIFFGPVAVAATCAAQASAWSWTPALAGVGVGFLASALIGVNNLRDEPTDRVVHKRTLAVRLGLRWARLAYCGCVIAAAAVALALALCSQRWGSACAVIACAALIPSMQRVMAGARGTALNRELAATAQAILGYGALFAIGWVL